MSFAERSRSRGVRAALGSQDGSMLIEVLIGALVLAIVTAAVLNGLDGAQATGRANKDRSVAATLAQQDIERLRALPITALIDVDQERTVDVTGVRYTVASATAWTRDNSDELSCTDDTTQAAYLKVTSTATAPASSEHPVVETTLITPPAAFSSTTGTATVRITDRNGAVRPGVGIRLTGPASLAATTNDLGCAIFSFIEPGTYAAEVQGDYVAWDSNQPATVQVPVIAGKTTPVQMEVEPPASMRVHFKSPSGASVEWSYASVPHANLPGGVKVFGDGSYTSLLDLTDLFPQLGGYGVYAGRCEANNPENPWWGDASYFGSDPARHADLDPGDAYVDVDAILPTLVVSTIRDRRQELNLRADQIDDPVGPVDCRLDRAARYDRTRLHGDASSNGTTATDAISLPFGTYRVCVDDGSKRFTADVALDAAAEVEVTFDLRKTSTNRRCVQAFS